MGSAEPSQSQEYSSTVARLFNLLAFLSQASMFGRKRLVVIFKTVYLKTFYLIRLSYLSFIYSGYNCSAYIDLFLSNFCYLASFIRRFEENELNIDSLDLRLTSSFDVQNAMEGCLEFVVAASRRTVLPPQKTYAAAVLGSTSRKAFRASVVLSLLMGSSIEASYYSIPATVWKIVLKQCPQSAFLNFESKEASKSSRKVLATTSEYAESKLSRHRGKSSPADVSLILLWQLYFLDALSTGYVFSLLTQRVRLRIVFLLISMRIIFQRRATNCSIQSKKNLYRFICVQLQS